MERISKRPLARSIRPVILSICTIAIDCTYCDNCAATRNLISNNNMRSRMTKKCENITDITLSSKFHSGNNPRSPMEKWECYWYCIVRWNLILTIIPWSRCITENIRLILKHWQWSLPQEISIPSDSHCNRVFIIDVYYY